MTPKTSAPTPPQRALPKINKVSRDDITASLKAGFADFLARPLMSGFFGLFYAVFGLLMVATPGIIFPGLSAWFVLKFLCVILLSGFHGWLVKCQKAFAEDKNTYTERQFRFANEVPTLLMIVIVIMVVVRPF